MCCEFHIGNYVEKRNRCKKKCNDVIADKKVKTIKKKEKEISKKIKWTKRIKIIIRGKNFKKNK